MVGQWPAETETQQKAAGMMPDRDEKPSMLQIALDHARQGYRVFPVIPNGKVPAVAGWNHQATTDPDFIKHWWTQRDPVIGVIRERDHNVGVLCGEDLTVLDIDVK
ncbi:MAG: bifunctional DNA primase/polymerase [bacterium]